MPRFEQTYAKQLRSRCVSGRRCVCRKWSAKESRETLEKWKDEKSIEASARPWSGRGEASILNRFFKNASFHYVALGSVHNCQHWKVSFQYFLCVLLVQSMKGKLSQKKRPWVLSTRNAKKKNKQQWDSDQVAHNIFGEPNDPQLTTVGYMNRNTIPFHARRALNMSVQKVLLVFLFLGILGELTCLRPSHLAVWPENGFRSGFQSAAWPQHVRPSTFLAWQWQHQVLCATENQ